MSTEERQPFCQDFSSTSGDIDSRESSICETRQNTTLRWLFDYCQHHFSLDVQRIFLLLFILLQVPFFTGFSAFQYMRIEDDAARTLRNTALLQAQQFETSMNI